MSILIKNMKMPQSCAECDIKIRCFANAKNIEWLTYHPAFYEERLTDCPLIEVPTPHGRLIDADAAYNQFLNLMDIQGAINPCQLGTILVDAPTIIESEGE